MNKLKIIIFVISLVVIIISVVFLINLRKTNNAEDSNDDITYDKVITDNVELTFYEIINVNQKLSASWNQTGTAIYLIYDNSESFDSIDFNIISSTTEDYCRAGAKYKETENIIDYLNSKYESNVELNYYRKIKVNDIHSPFGYELIYSDGENIRWYFYRGKLFYNN